MENFNGNTYRPHGYYDCIDSYINPDDEIYWDESHEWLECPKCNLKPKVWLFNNGESTACGCHESKYDHFSVRYESILSVFKRCNRSVVEHNSDGLRIEWNKYCNGEDYMTHEKLMKDNRW